MNGKIPVIGDPNNPGNILQGAAAAADRRARERPKRACNLQPRFYPQQQDQVLQTLLITTSYSGGRIVPFLGMFYDWVGGVVVQPGVTLVQDPFRFTFDYTSVTSVAAQQFGTVRDKDNVRFQVEYVF